MALLDFLKRKKEVEKAKKVEKKTQKPLDEKKEEVKVINNEKFFASKDTTFSYEAVSRPHVSEKGTLLGQINQYVFEVSPNYNKKELKRTIEGMYKVNVLSVNVIKIPPKKRRLGKTEGFRKAYKKAVVTIKEGQKIEII